MNGHRDNPTPRWRTVFDLGSTALMIGIAVTLMWQGRERPTPVGATNTGAEASVPRDPVPIGDSAVRGSASASVAIIEYADFSCGACAHFASRIEPALVQEYVDTGSVMLVFKHFPLDVEGTALAAARAAVCADRQVRFTDMHNRLFRVRGLREADMPAAARELGLDLAVFESCTAARETEAQVMAEKAEGAGLGVKATPTFFVGTVGPDRRVRVMQAFVGAKPIEELRTILDRVLAN